VSHGVKRDGDLSIDGGPDKVLVGVVVAGRGTSSISVNRNDRPRPHPPQRADDE
jgi:hypothetical protein